MGVECTVRGTPVTLVCDLCGRETRHLEPLRGPWARIAPRRKRDDIAWLCAECMAAVNERRNK